MQVHLNHHDNNTIILPIDQSPQYDQQTWKKFLPFWAPERSDQNPSADFWSEQVIKKDHEHLQSS
jgi:hypothetical protein